MPPVYPFLLGLALEAFGPAGARVARWLVGASAYSLLFAMLPWVGGWLGAGRRAGVVGGLIGALLVPCWWINQIEPLAALAMALLVVAYARRWRIGLGGAASSLALGVAAGAACHLLPSLLPIVLGCAAFELWWSRDGRKWRLSVLVLIGLVVAAIPWTLRNDIALGDVYFVRSNLGLELRVGNHDGADADMEVSSRRGTLRHPGTQEREARAVRDLGEAAYMRQAKAEALDWIRAHPAAFLGLTARRFGYFWFGRPGVPTEFAFYIALTLLALAGAWRILPTADWPTRAAILVVPITFPLIYYVVAYMPRYREPIDWLLLLLAGAAVSRRPVGE